MTIRRIRRRARILRAVKSDLVALGRVCCGIRLSITLQQIPKSDLAGARTQ
jgi:hypothetical protein